MKRRSTEQVANDGVREPVENLYAGEPTALRDEDAYSKPENWNLSPKGIKTFLRRQNAEGQGN